MISVRDIEVVYGSHVGLAIVDYAGRLGEFVENLVAEAGPKKLRARHDGECRPGDLHRYGPFQRIDRPDLIARAGHSFHDVIRVLLPPDLCESACNPAGGGHVRVAQKRREQLTGTPN